MQHTQDKDYSIDLEQALEKSKRFIILKGQEVLKKWDEVIITQSYDKGADVSTNFDKEIEKEFYQFTQKNFPQTGFIGEECPELIKEGDYQWTIDPIDGTKFFAKGIAMWCMTISLNKNKKPILGLVYDPMSKLLYYGMDKKGAFVNNKKMKTISESDISHLQVAWDQSYSFKKLKEKSRKNEVLKENLELISTTLTSFYNNFYRVRNFGSGTLSITWVAQGLMGAYVDIYRPDEKFVDLYGPILLAKEAGAVVYEENMDKNHRIIIVAANNQVLEAVLGLVKKN